MAETVANALVPVEEVVETGADVAETVLETWELELAESTDVEACELELPDDEVDPVTSDVETTLETWELLLDAEDVEACELEPTLEDVDTATTAVEIALEDELDTWELLADEADTED